MHLKCDNQKDADNWVKALQMLQNVYKDKKLVDFDINRKYKDKLDVRVSNMIMKEIEQNNWERIKGNFNYDRFLEDKGIKSYYDDFSDEMKRNRVYFGKFKRNSGEKLDPDLVGDEGIDLSLISMGNSVVLPKNIFWDTLYGIIFTSKSFRDEIPDEEFLRESKLPPSIKIDTLYLFKYEGPGDTSQAIFEYSGKFFNYFNTFF